MGATTVARAFISPPCVPEDTKLLWNFPAWPFDPQFEPADEINFNIQPDHLLLLPSPSKGTAVKAKPGSLAFAI